MSRDWGNYGNEPKRVPGLLLYENTFTGLHYLGNVSTAQTGVELSSYTQLSGILFSNKLLG